MTVTINLSPKIEAEVLNQAKAEGSTLEDYLPRLIERTLATARVPLRQGSPEWLALLHQAPPVAELDPATGQRPPVVSREDLRREHLYEERS